MNTVALDDQNSGRIVFGKPDYETGKFRYLPRPTAEDSFGNGKVEEKLIAFASDLRKKLPGPTEDWQYAGSKMLTALTGLNSKQIQRRLLKLSKAGVIAVKFRVKSPAEGSFATARYIKFLKPDEPKVVDKENKVSDGEPNWRKAAKMSAAKKIDLAFERHLAFTASIRKFLPAEDLEWQYAPGEVLSGQMGISVKAVQRGLSRMVRAGLLEVKIVNKLTEKGGRSVKRYVRFL